MKRSMLAILSMCVLALATLPAWSQTTLATVEGKVTASGKPLADVTVVLTALSNGRVFKMKTDKDGRFFSVGVPRGDYDAEVVNASGDKLYTTKSRILGEGGKAEFLALDVDQNSGKSTEPKISAEEMEAVKAKNAK